MAADEHGIEDTYPSLRTAAWNTDAQTQDKSFAKLSNLNLGTPHGSRKRPRADDLDDGDSREPNYKSRSTPPKRQTRSSGKATRSVAW